MVDITEVQETVEFERGPLDIYGDAHPKALLRAIQEDGDFLTALAKTFSSSTKIIFFSKLGTSAEVIKGSCMLFYPALYSM